MQKQARLAFAEPPPMVAVASNCNGKGTNKINAKQAFFRLFPNYFPLRL